LRGFLADHGRMFLESGACQYKTREQKDNRANRRRLRQKVTRALGAENALTAAAAETDTGIALARLEQDYEYQEHAHEKMKGYEYRHCHYSLVLRTAFNQSIFYHFGKRDRIQTRAADQQAVDVFLGHDVARVFRLHTAAV